jgi:uncharacterized protein with NAD-binding domain and iron-sulfur cluster
MNGSDKNPVRKKRVCILGAGTAGLAAAYGLTDKQELRDKYDVTVYQVGWRLGGKCATGRSEPQKAVQQNCAHYLFGCYSNTLTMARDTYEELSQAGMQEFDDFDGVLLPRNLVALKECFQGQWETWSINFPTNSAVPGQDSTERLEAKYVVEMIIEWLLQAIFGWELVYKINQLDFDKRQPGIPPAWGPHAEPEKRKKHKKHGRRLRYILAAARFRRRTGLSFLDKALSWSLKKLRAAVWLIERGQVKNNLGARRRWVTFDMGCSLIIGLLDDRVLRPGGLEDIDKYDYRDWLTEHGASSYTIDSAPIKLWYQNSLAYHEGDPDKPAISAAISIIGQLYASLNYRGSVAFSLSHEVGDSIIAPLYIALKRRGVKFKFFHKAKDIVASPGGTSIEKVIIEQQVTMANGNADGYEPLIDVKQWPHCWPDSPLVDQFSAADRARFQAGNYDLESFYTDWQSQHPDIELKAGEDFDKVIFAMPHSLIPFYCKGIYDSNAKWKRLVDSNPMVESQSYRIWFNVDLNQLGWPYGPPIMSGYGLPYCTWEDDSQLAKVEDWSTDPKAIACVFGPLEAPVSSPDPSDQGYLPQQRAVVDQQSTRFATRYASGIWPDVGNAANPKGIDPAKVLLAVPRANSGPLERYTMTWPGALETRLRVDDTGFDNLLFAGDWTRNGIEAGSMEGATASGFQASRSICGWPKIIFNETISYN